MLRFLLNLTCSLVCPQEEPKWGCMLAVTLLMFVVSVIVVIIKWTQGPFLLT